MNRLIGIETEYGITLNTEKECDPVRESIELIKSYRREDFQPMVQGFIMITLIQNTRRQNVRICLT